MANELLSERDDLTKRFKAHVESATAIRIATAWITRSDALDALNGAKSKNVKVLVGIHGDATDPMAVRSVLEMFGTDSVRIIEDGPLFHPKLFHFTLPKGKRIVWIGSANFTGGGFRGNRELLLETQDKETAEKARAWFADWWKDLRHQDVEAVLKRYAKRRNKHGPATGLKELVEEQPNSKANATDRPLPSALDESLELISAAAKDNPSKALSGPTFRHAILWALYSKGAAKRDILATIEGVMGQVLRSCDRQEAGTEKIWKHRISTELSNGMARVPALIGRVDGKWELTKEGEKQWELFEGHAPAARFGLEWLTKELSRWRNRP